MDHCIGVAKALPKWLVEWHANNFLGCHGIHQPKIVDVDCDGACGVADSELIKRVEGVRAQLNTGADLSEFGRPFKHDASNTFLGKAERGGKAANTTTSNNKWLVPDLGHRRFLSAAMGMRLRALISTQNVSRVVTSKVERSRPHTRCLIEAGLKQCRPVSAF
jgi:hypothetical protein